MLKCVENELKMTEVISCVNISAWLSICYIDSSSSNDGQMVISIIQMNVFRSSDRFFYPLRFYVNHFECILHWKQTPLKCYNICSFYLFVCIKEIDFNHKFEMLNCVRKSFKFDWKWFNDLNMVSSKWYHLSTWAHWSINHLVYK